jgi:hypothetical protein
MNYLHVGVVSAVAAGRIEIREAQTDDIYVTSYEAGRSVASASPRAVPALAMRHRQQGSCSLKRPEVGDAVCFEESKQNAVRWGYLNRFLLATERAHRSRFVPRLV